MLELGIMITEKCDLQCGHCMFSCTSRGKDMSYEVINRIIQVINNNNIYSVNVYGGEPFLNLTLFKELFNRILYDTKIQDFFVSSNGSFMISPEKREYVFGLVKTLSECYPYSDITGIRVSNTSFHNACRSPRRLKGIEKLQQLILHPDFHCDEKGYEDFPFYTLMNKPFLLHVDKEKRHELMNPSGRALDNADLDYERCCHCPITCDIDNFTDLHINVKPDGNVSVCCTCEGCTVANIFEQGFDEKLIRNRITELREHLIELHSIDNRTRMVDFCETCKKYKIDNKGIHYNNK